MVASFSPTAGFALGFDVGGTDAKIGFVSPEGILLHKRVVPTPRGGAAGLVNGLTEIYLELQGELHREEIVSAQDCPSLSLQAGQALREDLLCEVVGVDVPGILDEASGRTIRSANLGWGDFPMREELSETFGVPVVLGHDVRSGAYGEARFGAGGKDCFFVAVGTGISAGLILDGKLVSRGGCTGEIGQVLFANPDRDYPAAYPAFSEAEYVSMEQLASAGFTSVRYCALSGTDKLSPEAPDSKEVFARERRGDALAHHVVETGVQALTETLAAVVATLGPVPIVIGGGQSKEGESYLNRLREATASRLVNVAVPPFTLAKLGSDAQLLGIAAQALDKWEGTLAATTC
ncbi:MAG: ROK family protein [Mobiluncus porci]|uniref:ROK family protein n=1 Tax=Mobiluncus porci TaxID=2652278 RepID=A0A7K0K0Z5_9ACTO|nr:MULTISPECIES: ROK family protein [Mobiluncus]MCI6584614.1 ROK family protein [Mobiluncus sp.]MDD7541545.1 ROK family protein [Mobiluncus porci]MDY5748530.1 ROK family protein [Mobiluncus porci]MST48710.1 ROK family protein [Mobiluncus porci]